jgi:hypothetical protein
MSGTRGERQDLTLPSRSALHERPKPFAVRLRFGVSKPKLHDTSPGSPPGAEAPWRFTCGSPFQAEACPGSPVGSLLLAEAAGSSPFGSLLRPKPWQFSRRLALAEAFASSPFGSPRPAEALAVHLSRNSVPAEAGRFFRPKPRAGRSRSFVPVRVPVKAEALAVLLRSAVSAEADRFLRFWIPFRAEALPVLLWRFREAEASGSTGLLDEACRPRKC